MNDDVRLSDELLHDMLERRARRGTADGLRGSILGATGATAQRRSSLRVLAGGRPPLRLLAVAALLAASVGAGLLVAGQRQPLPPAEHFTDFTVPFDFRPVDGVPTDSAILDTGLVEFNVGGLPGRRGVVIANPSTGAFSHSCPSGARMPIRQDPEVLLDDLHAATGLTIRRREHVTFDGRAAVAADVDRSTAPCDYGDLHTAGGIFAGLSAPANTPSRWILTDVGGKTVVLEAWAATPEELEAWLPTATRFLDGIHFTGDKTP